MIQKLGYNHSGNIGLLGIANSNGDYTYYQDYVSAIANSKAGDTIVQFADIVETRNIIIFLKTGVNINLNGFTFEFKHSGAYFTTRTGIPVTMTIMNGQIRNLTGYCIYMSNSGALTLTTNCVFTGGFYAVGSHVTVGGVYYPGTLAHTISGGFVSNIVSYAGGYIYPTQCSNSVFWAGVFAGGCSYSNCFFYSSGGIAIGAEGSSTFRTYNCVAISTAYVAAGHIYGQNPVVNFHTNLIAISTGNGAICFNSSTLTNVFAYSTVSSAIAASVVIGGSAQNGSFSNTFYGGTLISTVAATVNTSARYNSFIGTNIECQWNNAGGHGIYNPTSVIRCFIKVTHKNAKCILSSFGASQTTYVANIYQGSITPVDTNNIVQTQQNTPDLFGNILLG